MTYEQNPQYPPPSSNPGQQPYGQPNPAYGQQTYDQQHYGQPGAGYSPGHGPAPEGSSDDRTWATISHVGSFVAAWAALGILCPILVLLAKSSNPYVRHHAYESLNFQLNALGWIAITTVVAVLTLGIGAIFFLPVGAWYLWFVIVASMRASAGDWYRYPLIIRLFNA